MIGVTVGNMAAESACQTGKTGPNDAWKTAQSAKIDDLIARYVVSSDQHSLEMSKALFAGDRGAGSAGLDGVANSSDLTLPDWAAGETLQRTKLVFSNDSGVARGEWTTLNGQRLYVVDFVLKGWGAGWKILHVRAATPDSSPAVPENFCHPVNLTALW
jgi:hypothetical protein